MKRVLTLMALLAFAASAQAATVNFSLLIDEDGAGTFNLYGSASLGDNFGIASYGVPLQGGIVSLDHNSPNAVDLNTFLGVGFRFFRSADGVNLVTASQDTITPSPHIQKGMGQGPGDLATAPGVTALGGIEQQVYGNPLLLASGTYAGPLPDFDLANIDLGANVFTDDSTIATEAAQVQTSVTVVPEPSSILMGALAGLALVATIRRRKRRS